MSDPGYGPPVDALDSVCKEYKDCVKCARMKHGDSCIGEFVKYRYGYTNGQAVCKGNYQTRPYYTGPLLYLIQTRVTAANATCASATPCLPGNTSPRLTSSTANITCSGRPTMAVQCGIQSLTHPNIAHVVAAASTYPNVANPKTATAPLFSTTLPKKLAATTAE